MRRTNKSRFRCLWFFLLFCSFSFVSPQLKLHAQQEEDVVLKALKDELARSVDKLQLKDMEKPYYIEYSVEETETFAVRAIFGAIASSSRDKSRFLQVGVRV
jgi:hypothetical protein